jgi:hypothetical protein
VTRDRNRIRPAVARTDRRGYPDVIGGVLALAGAALVMIGLDAPNSLATSASFGQYWSPAAAGPWSPLTTPIVLTGAGLVVLFVGWEVWMPFDVRPLVALRRSPGILAQADLPGALLLAAVLGGVVVLFSSADPGRQVVASSGPVLGPVIAIGAAAFWWRQRRARHPLLRPSDFGARPAWGALAVNVALGAALMAALVDIPLFARATVDPSSEVAAAFVLVRFLVAVPIGAVVGGLLCRGRAIAPLIAAGGMALATLSFLALASWSQTALGGGPRWSDVELVVGGLGFGLAVAPLNVAILGAVRPGVHALAGALAVVARTVGMLAGLSALTAIALHRFYEAEARLPSPFKLCPTSPASCPAYNTLETNAVVSELHTIFVGAAICAGVAGVLALVLLRNRHLAAAGDHRTSDAAVSADAEGTTMSSGLRPDLG